MSLSASDQYVKKLIEAALFSSDKPMSVDALKQTVLADKKITKKLVKTLISELQNDYTERGVELVEVASGYRFQASVSVADDLGNLWSEKQSKYSRALLETLALIAYKQPITRGEIENVRGVSVSSNIIRTLTDRNWIKVVGHKEVPGRPSLYATTNEFLDYFCLQGLEQLPELMEPQTLEQIAQRLDGELLGVDLTNTDQINDEISVEEN